MLLTWCVMMLKVLNDNKTIIKNKWCSAPCLTKAQTDKPKLTLEGLLMTIFYCSEFKNKLSSQTNMYTDVICVLRYSLGLIFIFHRFETACNANSGRPRIHNITVDGILYYKQATTPDRIG